MNIIEIKDLSKNYDKFSLGPINLNIPKGEIIGLIGENGAGKTTLIKLLLNIIKPDKGKIKLFNRDYLEGEEVNKKDIGVVLDDMFFPEILTPLDINLIMKNIYANWDKELYFKYLEEFNLPKDKTIKTFSKGMKKKLEIITSIAHHPKLLILDEPTSGLDPVVRKEVLDIFLNFMQSEDHTIILSTHITSDLENVADRIVFIDQGQIVLDDLGSNIMDSYGILKCSIEEFKKLDKSDILKYQNNKYNYEVLIKNKNALKKKYKGMVIDKITLDELMVLMIKGEEK